MMFETEESIKRRFVFSVLCMSVAFSIFGSIYIIYALNLTASSEMNVSLKVNEHAFKVQKQNITGMCLQP